MPLERRTQAAAELPRELRREDPERGKEASSNQSCAQHGASALCDSSHGRSSSQKIGRGSRYPDRMFLAQARNIPLVRAFEKNVLPEESLVQRSHGVSENENIREKIGTLCMAALKKHANRNHWKPAIVK